LQEITPEMTNNRDTIINEISALAGKMFSNGNGEVYLYGSRARQDAAPTSDWDILVITDDSMASDDDFMQFAFPFAEIGWRHGQQITPLHYTRSQWEAEKNTVFYHNVTHDAIRL